MTLTGKHTPARRMAARQLVLSRELRRERKHLTQWAPGQYRDAAMQRIERDCVGYLATWVDDEAITEAMEAPCA